MLKENRAQDAEALLLDVEKSILAMPGPDAWSEATFQLETIAQRARDAGDWHMASVTARNMIAHNPNYAGGYYAMALVARQAHDPAGEAELLASAQKLWSKADAELPELARMQTPVTQKKNQQQP